MKHVHDMTRTYIQLAVITQKQLVDFLNKKIEYSHSNFCKENNNQNCKIQYKSNTMVVFSKEILCTESSE